MTILLGEKINGMAIIKYYSNQFAVTIMAGERLEKHDLCYFFLMLPLASSCQRWVEKKNTIPTPFFVSETTHNYLDTYENGFTELHALFSPSLYIPLSAFLPPLWSTDTKLFEL